MNLYKRGNIWWVEFERDGVRYRKSCQTTKRAEAMSWVRSIDMARKAPTFEAAVEILKIFYNRPVEGILDVDAAWDEYIKIARATGKDAVEPRTMERRKNRVENFVEWLKGQTPVRTVEGVNGPVAARYAEALALEGLKTKTRKNIISELSTVWKLLEKASTSVRNPWGALTPRDVDGESGRPFKPCHEQLVLDAAKKVGKMWYEICQIMRITGQRYSSVARLKWSEIQGDVIRHKPPKTVRHNIEVIIPIIDPLREVLDSIPKDGAYLFPRHAELYGHRGEQSRELPFSEVLTLAGLEKEGYTIHSWRHSAATVLAKAGASKDIRKALLGHTTDEMAEHYDKSDHLDEKRMALEAAERIRREESNQ